MSEGPELGRSLPSDRDASGSLRDAGVDAADAVPDASNPAEMSAPLQSEPGTESAEPAAEPESTAFSPASPLSRLPALTGLRAFAAFNLVFFHFSNPKWFGIFAPIVDNGYTAVSFFLLLSGFILSYNYSERAQRGELSRRKFWIARLSRLYPIYLVALLISWQMLRDEWHVRSHSQFTQGVVLTPLLLQGWLPDLSTFWNTPAWTMSTEAFFYLLFPFVVAIPRPRSWAVLLALLGVIWLLGLSMPLAYMHFHPDGDLHPGRYTEGFWIRALKFSPPPHLPSFLFGVVLAYVDARMARRGWGRLALGLFGVASTYAVLYHGDSIPYVIMHDGLLMPLFGCAILGLAGDNFIARFFGLGVFVAIGQTSYCLYILHFNLWTLIHRSGLLEKTGMIRFDPWFSYGLLGAGAALGLVFIERPMQKRIRRMIA